MEYGFFLRMDLQFFADNEGGEKTEEPTAKKIEDSRKEGQVAKSQEISSVAHLAALFLCLKLFMSFTSQRLINVFPHFYREFDVKIGSGFDDVAVWQLLLDAILYFFLTAAPYILAALVISFFAQSLQFKWKVTTKPLKPKFSKINPLSGFKRLFSKDKLVELALSLVKISVFAAVIYSVIKERIGIFITAYDMTIRDCLGILFDIVMEIGIKICMAYLIIAFADLIYRRWKHKKDLKMTKQEVKDEFKNSEGDPQIKGQQRARMRQAAQRRMMQAVPEADVVITNPTHFAVALKYDNTVSQAPVLVAKGADYLAFKIRDIALENDVDVVENKPLARMLYANVELGDEIPPELYQAVAEVLAYVYQLHKKVS